MLNGSSSPILGVGVLLESSVQTELQRKVAVVHEPRGHDRRPQWAAVIERLSAEQVELGQMSTVSTDVGTPSIRSVASENCIGGSFIT